jgi:hypothetical protein
VIVRELVTRIEELERKLAEREALVASLEDLNRSLEGRNAALQSSLINHASEIEILKRRIFGPRSERGGTSEMQLTLADLLADQKDLQRELDELTRDPGANTGDEPPAKPPPKERPKPKGRRDLSVSKLPHVVLDITDPHLAEIGRLIGFDESRQLIRQPALWKVLVKRVAKYEVPGDDGPTVERVTPPVTLFPRGLLHTSAIAWLAVQKFALGVPHYRLEKQLADEGVPLDRSTMSRTMEQLGNVLGATVMHAALEDARTRCGVLSTDATGAAIQPGPREGGPKRPCKKGHFFTIVADRDHVLFEYTTEHTSKVVADLFEGFSGYLQSDASSVYDILERGPPDADAPITLVGCWAHCRRYFFEAAICKHRVGVVGLERVRALYRQDESFGDCPPAERRRLRQEKLAPLIDDFFEWVKRARRETVSRDLAARALGYAENQEEELRRVLLDGRLPLDNNRSERALRRIVVGRKNWLFYGSDVHAQAAAAIFSVVASCRLHRLDPWSYLDEVLRALPYWPRDRYIELTPLHWAATRARLDPADLANPLPIIAAPPRV